MTNPTVISTAQKAIIGPRAALLSTLRLWFLYRDQALWAFVSGAEEASPLDEIVIGEETNRHIAEANEFKERAQKIAQQIAEETGKKASVVMREALAELFATEQPRFLLAVAHVPGSF